MKVLVGKCFGIGNAVMAVPMIKALQFKPNTVVDILIGNTQDDVGAFQVLSKVIKHPGKIYVNSALEGDYDVAIMAIPFDGRWKNGVHFRADQVMDGRTRPDPSTTGLSSWKDHESRYQMQNARSLGFSGVDPTCDFMPSNILKCDRDIYVGLGYKKDAAGFWKVKHWGNENYASFISKFLEKNPDHRFVTTGDMADLKLTIGPISRWVNNRNFEFKLSANLDEAFQTVARCGTYIGNDTGMMHVASSTGSRTLGMFFLENSIVKSSPLRIRDGQLCDVIDGTGDRRASVTPDFVANVLEEALYAEEAKHE